MAETKQFTLADQTFDIPHLPLGVMKVVLPKSAKLMPVMQLLKVDPTVLEEDTIDLMIDIVFAGIKFTKPQFMRIELEAMDATIAELSIAVTVIIEQCGAKRAAAPGPGGEMGKQSTAPSTTTS